MNRVRSACMVLMMAATILTSKFSHSQGFSQMPSHLVEIKEQIASGRASIALDMLDRIHASEKTSSEYHFLRGRASQELKKNTDAIESYSIAIYLDPNHIRARINKSLALGALGDIEGALEDLNEAAKIEPNNPVISMNLGVTLAGLNRPKDAIKEFDIAIKLDRKYSDAYRNRGIVRHFLNNTTGACRDWRQAVSYGDSDAIDWLVFYCGKKQPREPSNTPNK